MYLKSLEIFGFKSFFLKTTLKFDPGITVIVGPNGCGKSNVFDAIRWALGEQSPKSLRGAKMEDVISNGTALHPSLNYAEVTLIFSNDDKYLPIEYKEVAIMRRLYRSGESQYFINRSPCRLKDVQDMFTGTGVGETSYSFVEQGRVEALLSCKPEEKRLIFDEASGIIKYKDRKKETLRKLKDTEDNILRLDDIIQEVQRQIRYLERQVGKAKKYNQIEEELTNVEKKIAVLKIKDIEGKINEFLEEISRLKKKEEITQEAISKEMGEKNSVDLKIRETQQALENVNSKTIASSSRVDSYNNHIEIDKLRINEITERLKVLGSSLDTARSRAKLHKERIEEENKALLSFDDEEESLRANLQGLKESLNHKVSQIGGIKKSILVEKSNVLKLEERKTTLNNSLIELGAQLKNLLSRKKRLSIDEARIDNYAIEQKEKYNTVKQEAKNLQGEVDSLKGRKQRLRLQMEEAERLIDESKKKSVEIEKSIVELNSYLEFLKDLKVKYEDFPIKKRAAIVFNEDPKDVNKLIASLRGVEFSRIETSEGVKYQADVEVKIISLPEEELVKRIASFTEELSSVRKIIDDNEGKKRQLSRETNEEENVLLEKDKALRDRIQDEETIEDTLKRLSEERGLLESELSQCLEDIKETESRKSSYEKDLSYAQAELDTAVEKLGTYEKSVTSIRGDISSLEVNIAKKEAEVKASGEHKEALLAKLSILEEEEGNINSLLSSLEKEQRDITERRSFLEQELISLQDKIDEEKNGSVSFDKEKVKLNEELNGLEHTAEVIADELRRKNDELEKWRSGIYSKKLEIQKLDFEKTKIMDYLEQVYHIKFAVDKEDASQESVNVLDTRRDELKKKISAMGEVNLVAIDEFEELKTRYDFLTAQKQDLTASEDSLKKAIQKINRVSKEVFMDTFQKVEAEFKKYFRFLFGGGRAQLVLLDESNVLESGVEIEVQPPGKKLQNALLLSGGEKALTAIALIFSIFKVKPSPLCVLDEIDAPLDEANVARFNNLLVEFSPTAQFIAITHNKNTMSKASVLYGVTMEEKGISKLVSVRLAQEKESSQEKAVSH